MQARLAPLKLLCHSRLGSAPPARLLVSTLRARSGALFYPSPRDHAQIAHRGCCASCLHRPQPAKRTCFAHYSWFAPVASAPPTAGVFVFAHATEEIDPIANITCPDPNQVSSQEAPSLGCCPLGAGALLSLEPAAAGHTVLYPCLPVLSPPPHCWSCCCAAAAALLLLRCSCLSKKV